MEQPEAFTDEIRATFRSTRPDHGSHSQLQRTHHGRRHELERSHRWHRQRGEWALKVGGRELGHLHGDHIAHFAFPRAVWEELHTDGRITHHPIFPGKVGWAEGRIDNGDNVEECHRDAAKQPPAGPLESKAVKPSGRGKTGDRTDQESRSASLERWLGCVSAR